MISWVPALGLAVLLAQPDGVTLAGTVRDAQSRKPVVGARVVLADLGRATVSGEDGRYAVRAIPPGPQHVEVRRLGYATRLLHVFVPAAGAMQLDLALQPEPLVLRTLEVFAPVIVRGVETDSARYPPTDVALSAAAVRNHPLLAEPDVLAALSGGAVTIQPESPSGLHVHGGRTDQVTFLLDGVPVLSPYHALGLFSAWNPDALAHVRLDPVPDGIATPDALAGVVAAQTRRPANDVHAAGAFSSSQARVTMDGPLPLDSGGFLVSARLGFPGYPVPEEEVSYVRGQGADWLATLHAALAGGELRLLGYENRNRTRVAAAVLDEALDDAEWEDVRGTILENRFDWSGRSWGGEWARRLHRGRLRIRGWHASADASAHWAGATEGPLRLASARRDVGGALVFEAGQGSTITTWGARVSRSGTRYDVTPLGLGAVALAARETGTLVAAASVEHSRPLSSSIHLEAGMVGALYDASPRLAPRLAMRWLPHRTSTLTLSLARTYQSGQSLANGESVVGHLFPTALPVGTGAQGVPLARSDQAILAAELRPAAAVRIGAELYVRGFDGVVLVAPVTAQPFALDTFAVGSGTASGAAVALSVGRARYALIGSYGYERVRHAAGDSAYVPAFAAAHALELGLLLVPRATLSVRLGLRGAFGRRSSELVGPVEWEACNLLDRGCEFAGSPQQRRGSLGALRPPAYLRLDVGARKHWHVHMGRAAAEVGLYATLGNVLGRRNRLTRTVDPLTGEHAWIEMQSRAPLVAGLDWRF